MQSTTFHEHEVLHRLKHFLPAQAPLKDFIHHNTLHAFQNISFQEAIKQATEIFGYKTSLTIDEYRVLLASGKIKDEVLREIIIRRKGSKDVNFWMKKLLHEAFIKTKIPRVGMVRAYWKNTYRLDLDAMVHPTLFRILCSYLDQGIAMWNFPVWHKGFLSSIREMERSSFTSFFKTKYVKQLLLDGKCGIEFLLDKLVGDPALYEHYLFDQQFAHQGWSGMVSAIEDNPDTLLDHRKISIHDLITFELLLELDALTHQLGKSWKPLGKIIADRPVNLFAEVPTSELSEAIMMFQEAYEWTYYNAVLGGLQRQEQVTEKTGRSFQAMFCIDDRECSIRRYLEKFDPTCQTFGTPGFFGVEFFYKPEHGKFLTKLCPAPVTPKYLIKEIEGRSKQQKDLHFTKQTHSLFRGWLITQTLGFWSAIKLFINIFRPSVSPATATSFRHMDKFSKLTIENHNPNHRENDLQVGFTIEEMANRVEGLLASIGLVKDFASIIYVVGHGSSSVNNPHFAAYDCGACSGRPGSVNARVICHMANHKQVRNILALRGIEIPDITQFVGALHDTTRDEVVFFDEGSLSDENKLQHTRHEQLFSIALDHNAKERSRRFEIINSALSPEAVHDKVRLRSVSLFEPRPELNHATNALCIVGDRSLTRGLFLDRRAFLNSYDYRIDPQGKYLFSILKAAAPVCGGINLEYYFSRVDNQKLGAGTKLPHNVMGLFGVANGIDGDLRPGLPNQMIEVHDPVRLLIVVQHYPEVVLETIQRNVETYEWFINNWVNLVVMHPETKEIFVFREGELHPHEQFSNSPDIVTDLELLVETHQENLPVYLIA
ncbi:DUF2309 domain-containing protein [Chryseotalea sanaruensis]|uniref:Probable inorganic carbon transporter subunit DabA n=1 Tax=Chryseotalea sanaruensis TaxID=2482724 RepID=A0A401U8M2_9BACT|nr:DUF2309 domain-containing protein [Chryseotalea sanaruensis]GCC51226.1 DUF2309 domain-containing protein [Chryseotalea sanaruensis]